MSHVSHAGDAGNDIDVVNQNIARTALTLLQTKAAARKLGFEVFGRLSDGAIEQGVLTRPPCRFQVIRKFFDVAGATANKPASVPSSTGNTVAGSEAIRIDVILDIAHNADAIEAFVKKVSMVYLLHQQRDLPIRSIANCFLSLNRNYPLFARMLPGADF